MTNTGFKKSAFDIIKSIRNKISTMDFNPSDIEEKNYNYEFTVNYNKKKVKVQVYFGKKGNKIVIQGDPDSFEYNKIKSAVFDENSPEIGNDDIEYEEYIGSDECGKGDYFGPLVVAAVYVNKETASKLKRIGVRDSKDLSDTQIDLLAESIKQIIGNDFEICSLEPEDYNRLYDQYRNLNKLLVHCHSLVTGKLLKRVQCNLVITDKFSNRNLEIHPSIDTKDIKFIMETGAEKYTGVAAASILARNKFNEWFLKLKEQGLDLPKGASDAVLQAAKNIGKDKLQKFAKLHFKVTLKLR
ncbi:ribonuclease HIII [Melioribacter roseus P3M-2]|uniref:Ribonuclease n=2 Tax=Melioribacter roseus TaxID=1134405 RepID=I6Z681_MELRP|nr:ribonuclease HIII [Melioribacter roseus P3M-2]